MIVDPIPSPCVNNCCLNEEDICLGCFRSLDEMLAWGAASNAQRQAILDMTLHRKKGHKKKYRALGSSTEDSKLTPDS